MIEELVSTALLEIDPHLVRLSNLRYDDQAPLSGLKYQERPFVYEFYHQIRKLQEEGAPELQGIIFQGEVSKVYQGINHIPDLLLHAPNQSTNLAGFEFELSDYPHIDKDVRTLTRLRELGYQELYLILVGSPLDGNGVNRIIANHCNPSGTPVHIVALDCGRPKADRITFNDVISLAYTGSHQAV